MLEPVLVRTVPRFNLPLAAAALAAGLMIGAAVTGLDRSGPIAQATYSPALGAELVGLRVDPYVGPAMVLACLAQGAFCDEAWVPYAAIDAVADFSRLGPYGACVPGCLFVDRDDGWTCERHAFYLPLASLAW